MKTYVVSILVLGMTVLPAFAQGPIAVEGGIGFHSTYAWRGYEVASAPSVQPNLTLSFEDQGIWFDVWGAYAASERDVWEDADEVDFTLGYDRSFRWGPEEVWMSVGWIYYSFPRIDLGANSTQEAFAAVGMDGLFLSPSLEVYYDFDLVEAWYVRPSLAYSIALASDMFPALDLTASVGFTDGLADVDGETGFGVQDVALGASVDIEFGSVILTPQLGWSRADASIHPDQTMFRGGARIGYGF